MPSLEEVTEESEQYDAHKLAAQLGVHLVSQVLEEACAAVSSARRIGRFKGLRGGRLSVSGHADLFEILQGDNDIINENKENVSHLTTSTPHKDDVLKTKPDNSFIGQGDEEIDVVSKESVTYHDDEEIKQDIEEINTENEGHIFSSSMMRAVMDKLVETAFANASKCKDNIKPEEETPKRPEFYLKKLTAYRTALDVTTEASVIELEEDGRPKNMEEYCFSLLENAYEGDTRKDIAFYIDDIDDASSNDFDKIKVVVKAEMHAEIEENMDATIEELLNEETERAQKLEASRYEDAYLTLNRDYEQSSRCSDEDGDPILQDEKLPMQDVELLTASTEEEEDDDSSSYREPEEERKELAAISAVSGASGSRKSRTSLVSRCRTQGARLLSCLRGWWRRKATGKKKEPRVPGSIRGVCPLSPHARRRAASLLAQRRAYSPAPTRSVVWKFNTVNEALVNSAKWKEYSFEMSPERCEDHCQ